MNAERHAGHGNTTTPAGLALEAGGYRLTDLSAADATGVEGELMLTVRGPDGEPVTAFDLSHEKELHVVVVRTDGAHFRHLHPERDEQGTWSIPWQWDAAGSYRVYADFVPAATGEAITLSTVAHNVGGEVRPRRSAGEVTGVEVGRFEVSVDGRLSAGTASTLTATITRDGEAVTELEPYLVVYGHLVVLREGDLAYLHVHPHGDAPRPGETSGPDVAFEATAPTEGRCCTWTSRSVVRSTQRHWCSTPTPPSRVPATAGRSTIGPPRRTTMGTGKTWAVATEVGIDSGGRH